MGATPLPYRLHDPMFASRGPHSCRSPAAHLGAYVSPGTYQGTSRTPGGPNLESAVPLDVAHNPPRVPEKLQAVLVARTPWNWAVAGARAKMTARLCGSRLFGTAAIS
jgi:hypothetical protein